jgi:hypothetical protein
MQDLIRFVNYIIKYLLILLVVKGLRSKADEIEWLKKEKILTLIPFLIDFLLE